MPIAVKRGDAVEVIAQFFNNSSNLGPPYWGGPLPANLAPGSVSLNIAYTDAISGSTASFVSPMTLIGFSFSATWQSSAAAIGLAVISFGIGIGGGSFPVSPPDPVLRITQGT